MSKETTQAFTAKASVGCAFLAGLLVVVAPCVSSCERSPEVEYTEASHAVAKAERDVQRRQAALEESEAAAARWARRLSQDRQALLDAKRDLAVAEGRLTDSATDQVLGG